VTAFDPSVGQTVQLRYRGRLFIRAGNPSLLCQQVVGVPVRDLDGGVLRSAKNSVERVLGRGIAATCAATPAATLITQVGIEQLVRSAAAGNLMAIAVAGIEFVRFEELSLSLLGGASVTWRDPRLHSDSDPPSSAASAASPSTPTPTPSPPPSPSPSPSPSPAVGRDDAISRPGEATDAQPLFRTSSSSGPTVSGEIGGPRRKRQPTPKLEPDDDDDGPTRLDNSAESDSDVTTQQPEMSEVIAAMVAQERASAEASAAARSVVEADDDDVTAKRQSAELQVPEVSDDDDVTAQRASFSPMATPTGAGEHQLSPEPPSRPSSPHIPTPPPPGQHPHFGHLVTPTGHGSPPPPAPTHRPSHPDILSPPAQPAPPAGLPVGHRLLPNGSQVLVYGQDGLWHAATVRQYHNGQYQVQVGGSNAVVWVPATQVRG
jgi:hypothetical protein